MPVTAITTTIPDVLILEPTIFGDNRGFFLWASAGLRLDELRLGELRATRADALVAHERLLQPGRKVT